MDAHRLVPDDVVLASKKLGRDDAVALARTCDTLIVAKGKKVTTFDVSADPGDEMVDAMLGPTGNLRAPTVQAGRTLLVGFNEEAYATVLAS
jgi:arsenate reductase-like glutaredoxin family protein